MILMKIIMVAFSVGEMSLIIYDNIGIVRRLEVENKIELVKNNQIELLFINARSSDLWRLLFVLQANGSWLPDTSPDSNLFPSTA